MSLDFENELKLVFLDEASQLLEEAEASFLDLETNPDRLDLIEKIFRLAHNLKGSAKAVGFLDINNVAHEFETLLLKIKSQEIPNSPAIVSIMLKTIDFIRSNIQSLKQDLLYRVDCTELVQTLESAHALKTEQSPLEESPSSEAPQSTTTELLDDGFINFSESTPPVTKQDQLIVEEKTPDTSSLKTQVSESKIQSIEAFEKSAQTKESSPASSSSDETVRINLSRLEKLINAVGEVVILNSVLQQLVSNSDDQALKNTSHQLSKATREIQDLSMSLRMLPLKSIFQKMNRIVRDTGNLLSKSVHFVSSGEDTEVDKTVYEKISDPLVHLIRNAVDHGLEPSEERIKNGKSLEGRVTLQASQRSGKLVIEISDDGKGLDAEGLRQSAIKKNLIAANKKLNEQECYQLIFLPGFSTKEFVTDVSGRGVGMDVVKTNINQLGGSINIDTKKGSGTKFTISLPLSLAIIDGMIVKAADQRFVIPLSLVHETVRYNQNSTSTSSALGSILRLRDENLKLIPLTQILGLKKMGTHENSEQAVVVVRGEGPAFGVIIDEIIRRTQIVVKPLSKEMQSMPGLSGVTILGDGKPAFIVDLNDLRSKTRSAA